MLMLTLARLYRRLRRRRGIGFGVVLALLGLSVLGNAACFYLCERSAGQSGPTFGDALWYSVISITTIGYGDFSATTAGSRLGTFLFIVVLGMATFSVFLGMVIEWVTEQFLREQRGMSKIVAQDHILIVNFPSAARVMELIHELQSDPEHQRREIVVVTDQIESLPFSHDNVLFVRGSVLEQETYLRAGVENAKMAIVLASSYEDANSDAVAASASAVIDVLKPQIHIVAECLNYNHRMLFSSVRCDAIVYTQQISGNLLVQEVHDPGVSQWMEVITSNVKGLTLYSAEVSTDAKVNNGLSYADLAKQLLDRDINLFSVNRADESMMTLRGLYPQPGDRVIYAANSRYTWPKLLEFTL